MNETESFIEEHNVYGERVGEISNRIEKIQDLVDELVRVQVGYAKELQSGLLTPEETEKINSLMASIDEKLFRISDALYTLNLSLEEAEGDDAATDHMLLGHKGPKN